MKRSKTKQERKDDASVALEWDTSREHVPNAHTLPIRYNCRIRMKASQVSYKPENTKPMHNTTRWTPSRRSKAGGPYCARNPASWEKQNDKTLRTYVSPK